MTANSLVLALHLLILAPLALVLWTSKGSVPAALFYGILLVGLVTHHSGYLYGNSAATDIMRGQVTPFLTPPQSTVGDPLSGRGVLNPQALEKCSEALNLATRSGIILDRSNPARIIVSRSYWASLPPQIREALQLCLEASRPDPSSGAIVIEER